MALDGSTTAADGIRGELDGAEADGHSSGSNLLSELAKTTKIDCLAINSVAGGATSPVGSFLLASSATCFVEDFECLSCGEASHWLGGLPMN